MSNFDSTNKIHPSAFISENVSMGKNNVIGPNVVMDGNITLGDNNIIGVGCFLYNNIRIGNNNNLTGSISCGLEGEMGTKGDILLEDGFVIIGNHNKIREFVTIQSPVRRKETRIGNNCYIMARAHVAHDVILDDFVVMATNSLLGGGCTVQKNAYIGLGSITHQWLDIGESAMIGILATNTRHILPFAVTVGSPSRILKFNKVGAERRGMSQSDLDFVDLNYSKIVNGELTNGNDIIIKIREFDNNHTNCLKKFYESK